jgi:hypothetical protein
LSGTQSLTDVEEPPGIKRGGPIVVDVVYRFSLLAWLASRCFVRLRILLLRLDICPPSVSPQTLG